jgi:hypothetical protein
MRERAGEGGVGQVKIHGGGGVRSRIDAMCIIFLCIVDEKVSNLR